jgi:hypothetical protein
MRECLPAPCKVVEGDFAFGMDLSFILACCLNKCKKVQKPDGEFLFYIFRCQLRNINNIITFIIINYERVRYFWVMKAAEVLPPVLRNTGARIKKIPGACLKWSLSQACFWM